MNLLLLFYFLVINMHEFCVNTGVAVMLDEAILVLIEH